MDKKYLDYNVLCAAKKRISKIFDDFPKIYISFSAGKDSTVMMHLVCEEACRRQRKVGCLLVDLEAQYKLTIEHGQNMFSQYADVIEPYWVCLPLNLRNAVSQYQPQWCCWDPEKEKDWVRQPPKNAITDHSFFDFFKSGMEFEDFVPAFGEWYAENKLCACFVGIRSDESLNRWRTLFQKKQKFENLTWTTFVKSTVFNVYPIYDWRTKDVWIYHGKTKKAYNKLYDRMHQAGLTINQARICQPYGDDQRRGLWLYHVIESETWGRVVARVNGANQGALYSKESGNVLGNLKITKPDHHTWKSFTEMILASMPPQTSNHYRNKIAVFLRWYEQRGYRGGIIPDDGPVNDRNIPSWKRICKALLRNDYWCKGLSFSQHKTNAYKRYLKLMERRRREWNLI